MKKEAITQVGDEMRRKPTHKFSPRVEFCEWIGRRTSQMEKQRRHGFGCGCGVGVSVGLGLGLKHLKAIDVCKSVLDIPIFKYIVEFNKRNLLSQGSTGRVRQYRILVIGLSLPFIFIGCTEWVDSDCDTTGASQNHDAQQPVKKQTRQWAAWTRQEEESFFTALRQNFEKITCRVQSKNKDQVRHYYYRLLRRMNKLLGPGLCLDAKNSKDTNAAMLRWWSLLEKYSCKASKLHLKPRRFKLFIETLETSISGENCSSSVPTSNQGRTSGHDVHAVKLVLLDGQNVQKLGSGKGSSVRRSINVGANCNNCKADASPPKQCGRGGKQAGATRVYQLQSNLGCNGRKSMKQSQYHCPRIELGTCHRTQQELSLLTARLPPVLVNIRLGWSTKSKKRRFESINSRKEKLYNSFSLLGHIIKWLAYNLSTEPTCGPTSTAAYKKWEKAAIAGVSLVADAAEHLERTTMDKEVDIQVQKPFVPVGKDFPTLPTSLPNSLIDGNMQSSNKLKLQLFPIDEVTRRALEMDNHNPHLELTLSTRKKISSVLEHLNRKWGNSSVASGELILFPYSVQRENLVGYQRWTQDSVLSAADVYALIGSPSIFRLRYGWFPSGELVSSTLQAPLMSSSVVQNVNMISNNMEEQHKDSVEITTPPAVCPPEKLINHNNKEQEVSRAGNAIVVHSSMEMPNGIVRCIGMDANNHCQESFDGAASVPWDKRETGNGAVLGEEENKDDMRLRKRSTLSAGEWADSLTNISVGDLLSEVAHNAVPDNVDPPQPGSSECLQQGPFSSDSFDAAIAAHIYKHQNKTGFQPAVASHASSIWDAEETCDAFSFRNIVLQEEGPSTSAITSSDACKQILRKSLVGSGAAVQDLPEAEVPMDDKPLDDEPVDKNSSEVLDEDDDLSNEDPMDECLPDTPILESSSKDLNGLTDIYWPDSLGPLDLDMPSTRYHSEDLILSDSLSSFNRLLASSLDAFQNCSIFGLDERNDIKG
ncbi:unnamed protein product [Thlaspi arvense]|uniref:TSL-kinase interacting protein 1 n=1 Tax=Thlaspi arvense TaxID=13288 RepID=A0AAU9RHE4_THLAR|nr:unnamed protein product [Thlaspi arvense]